MPQMGATISRSLLGVSIHRCGGVEVSLDATMVVTTMVFYKMSVSAESAFELCGISLKMKFLRRFRQVINRRKIC